VSAPRPRTTTVAITAATVLVAFTVWLLGGWTHGSALTFVDDVVIVAVSLLALFFSVQAARTAPGRLRAAWGTLAVALVSWNIGQFLWMYDELVRRDRPFPSLADVFFVVFPIVACAALMQFWNRGGRQVRSLILLDGLIVAGSLFIVSWLTVMGPIYDTGAASRLEIFLSLAYPLLDVVVVTVASVVLVSADSSQRVVATLLTFGLVCMAVADTGYAYLSAQRAYFSGALVDTWWVAGLLLLTVAAALGREAPPDVSTEAEMPGWASVLLPFAPLMIAGAVLSANPPGRATTAPVLVAGVLLVIVVLARQFLAVQLSRRLLATVAEQALRDPLTGLGNRALFTDRLDHALQIRARSGGAVGLLILDLDDFKVVNDTLGHAAGDELLRQAGRRIAAAVRVGDTVARLGGDEFAVIVEGDGVLPEQTARRLVEAFDDPVAVEGHALAMGVSVGLAVANSAALSAEELLRQADLAMYAAKRSSRASVRRRAGGRSDMAQFGGEEDQLVQQLRYAVERQELSLVYQPKFHLASGAMVGVEALLRWPHPQRGIITPDEFLPIVRRNALIEPVTQFVIETALDDARDWRAAGLDIPVAVNLFPPSLAAPALPDRLGRALAERGLDSSALTVEITEDVLLDDIDLTRSVLRELRERGISVAIDDFGSGYSALWYLRDLPVDEVKLDRGFIAPVTGDPRAGAVARAVIDLAHVLLMKTVAEGVENLDTANWLRRHGCDIVQGYYFSPPLTAAELLSLPGPVAVKSS